MVSVQRGELLPASSEAAGMMYSLCALHLFATGAGIIGAVVASLTGNWGNLAFFCLMAVVNLILVFLNYPGGRE